MAGSVLRLTFWVVIALIPKYAVLQNQLLNPQQPFKLETNFLKEFMKNREDIFPFSFSTSTTSPRNNALTVRSVNYNKRQKVKPAIHRTISNLMKDNPKLRRLLREQLRYRDEYRRNRRRGGRRLRPVMTVLNQRNGEYIISSSSRNRQIYRRKTNPEQAKSLIDSTPIADDQFTKLPELSSNSHSDLITIGENEFENVNVAENEVEQLFTTPLAERPSKAFIESTSTFTPSTSIKSNRAKESEEDEEEEEETRISFLGSVINTLTQLPIIGNVLRASVDPLYRPIVRRLTPSDTGISNDTLMSGELDKSNWCFDELGCIEPTSDFFHPIYRPVNLPPYQREQIDTTFTIHSRNDTKGASVSCMTIEDIVDTSFDAGRPTKVIIHGYLHNNKMTWVSKMVRALLKHGDYNVITVDWSKGSYALYSQATANSRIVGMETSRLLKWLINNMDVDPMEIHIIGHSLGAHTAGYAGKGISGLGRITGLDPAEPFFQYMPESVRLCPQDALFVDVIHTDTSSFFALTGPRGFGLQQTVGHIDFYPNGGKEQPGCNELFTMVPFTAMTEGEDIVEGINAAQTELVNCDHIRAPKLFTDSLTLKCPYLGFACSSYKKYKKSKCFNCGERGEHCASMGINADQWRRENQTMVKMFLDTHYAPNFCKYHYLLTITFADPEVSTGTLRGRLKVTLITEEGSLRNFDLTSLTPLKFPRRGSRTFMLEHFEDLSNSQEALLTWTYEADLLDPLSFCVIFCRADLSVATVRIISIDTPHAASKALRLIKPDDENGNRTDEVIMCHKKSRQSRGHF